MTVPCFNSDTETMEFAREWLRMMSGFVGKNVRSCLTTTTNGETAWFPALMECFAFFDFLAGLYAKKEKTTDAEVKKYAKCFLDTTVYRDVMIEILWNGYRHKIAHQAHPYFVVDTSKDKRISDRNLRIVFKVTSAEKKLALNLTEKPGGLLTTPVPMVPWEVPYDHQITISPLRLQKDLSNSLCGENGFLNWLESSPEGKNYFVKTVLRFFPP